MNHDKFHILRQEALRQGDIILTSSPGHIGSEFIQAMTGSKFSHAILVVKPPYAVESALHGVVKFRLDRFAVLEPGNIRVRRLRADKNISLQKVVKYAERLKTREYASRDAMTSLFGALPKFDQGKYFCSQLIAESYAHADLPIFSDKKPEKITPAMLAETDELVDVCDVLTLTDALTLTFQPALLDSSNVVSPVELEAESRQRVVKLIKPVFTKHGFDIDDFYQAFSTLMECFSTNHDATLELDKCLAAAIHESGMLELSGKCFPVDSDPFFMDFYVRNALAQNSMSNVQKEKLLKSFKVEQVRFTNTNGERDSDVTKFKKMYLLSGLESARLELALCWDFLLKSTRAELTQKRAIEMLEFSLQDEQMNE